MLKIFAVITLRLLDWVIISFLFALTVNTIHTIVITNSSVSQTTEPKQSLFASS